MKMPIGNEEFDKLDKHLPVEVFDLFSFSFFLGIYIHFIDKKSVFAY